jgi:hypothetical protein
MNLIRSVVVFDAANLHTESAFWAGILGGHVFEDEEFHCVIDAAGKWRDRRAARAQPLSP